MADNLFQFIAYSSLLAINCPDFPIFIVQMTYDIQKKIRISIVLRKLR